MWLWTHHLVAVAVFALAVLFAARVLRERRSPASTFAWLLTIGLVPEVGVPLYLLFGGRKIRRRASQKLGMSVPATDLPGNRAHVLVDGEEAYTAILELIRSAKRSVHMATFILAADEVGRSVMAALLERAQAGVRVRVLVDDLFAWRRDRQGIRALRRAGGKVAFFMPVVRLPLRGWRLDLRNHRKILVVDGEAAIVGGMNVAREYMGPTAMAGRWRDIGVRVEGPVAHALDGVFRTDWEFAAGETLETIAVPAAEVAAVAAAAPPFDAGQAGHAVVRVVASGPDVRDDLFYDAMLANFFVARKRIWITTPYFVPDDAITRALSLAARRGVDVRVIVPARSNHLSADLAGAGYLRQVEEAGGHILRYAPAMLHGKVIITDDLGTLGSANMDMRSLFLNYEVALSFTSPDEVAALAAWIEALERDCKEGMPRPGLLRSVAEDVGRLLSPLV